MTNSADQDQEPVDLDLHCKGRAYLGSAGPGLKYSINSHFFPCPIYF